jgi:hypothetical protein
MTIPSPQTTYDPTLQQPSCAVCAVRAHAAVNPARQSPHSGMVSFSIHPNTRRRTKIRCFFIAKLRLESISFTKAGGRLQPIYPPISFRTKIDASLASRHHVVTPFGIRTSSFVMETPPRALRSSPIGAHPSLCSPTLTTFAPQTSSTDLSALHLRVQRRRRGTPSYLFFKNKNYPGMGNQIIGV